MPTKSFELSQMASTLSVGADETDVEYGHSGIFTGNLTVEGNLNVSGETVTVDATELSIADNMIYLNAPKTATITGASGSSTVQTYLADQTYQVGDTVTITGMNPSGYNKTAAIITAASTTSFSISGTTVTTFVSGGLSSARTTVHPDLGWAGSYDDGTAKYAGIFRDTTDGVFKFYDSYTANPDATSFINTAHASFTLAPIEVASIAVSGTVDGVDIAARDAILTSTTTTAGAALPLAGGTMTGNVNFGDNDKATFGAGPDLEIYHDGSHSYISDTGTGHLKILANSLLVQNPSGHNRIFADQSGPVNLYHGSSGGPKLITTSTGIDVTGTAVTDGLTVAGNVSVDGGTIKLDGNYPNGVNNVALGNTALDSVQSGGINNVAIGNAALTTNSTGDNNVAVGKDAGKAITTGSYNVLSGALTGDALTEGNSNVAIGDEALSADTLGSTSIAIGRRTLKVQNFTSATSGYNVAIGHNAGTAVTTGTHNVLIGGLAGNSLTTGVNNTIIGYDADATSATVSNEITLGNASATRFRIPGIGVDWTSGNIDATDATKLPLAGGTMTGNLTVSIPDGGGAPATTAILQLNGYEGRGAGIKIKDSVNSAVNPTSQEWFMGTGYSQSAFNIGYSSTGSQTSYAAQNKLTITTAGDVGIGTSSPQKKLEVTGDLQLDATNASIWLKSGAAGTAGKINWTYNTDATVYASAGIDYDTRATTGFHLDAGYPITIDSASSTGIKFITAASQRAVINNSGLGVTGNITATGTVGIGVTDTQDYKMRVDGAIKAGTAGATSGAVVLTANYADGQEGWNIGTEYSSAAIQLMYGCKPSTAASNTYISSVDNAAWSRSVLKVGTTLSYQSVGATTAAIGTTITMTEKFSIAANGNARFSSDAGVTIATATNNPTNGAILYFTDNTSAAQTGHIRYKHADGSVVPGSNEQMIFGGTEAISDFLFEGDVHSTGDVVAYFSDPRLKDFHGNITGALDKVNALGGYYFTENETAKNLGFKNNNMQVGVNADEVEEVLPEVVTTALINNTIPEDEINDYKTVKYEKLVPLLIEAIKELSAKVDAQQQEIDKLK